MAPVECKMNEGCQKATTKKNQEFVSAVTAPGTNSPACPSISSSPEGFAFVPLASRKETELLVVPASNASRDTFSIKNNIEGYAPAREQCNILYTACMSRYFDSI